MRKHQNRANKAFTLIEIVFGAAIFAILMLFVASIVQQAQSHWRRTESSIGQFREARTAFDVLTRNLGQATLASFEETSTSETGELVTDRKSDLHFFVGDAKTVLGDSSETNGALRGHVIGFQAPLGGSEHGAYRPLRGLMSGRVYFIEYGSDKNLRPKFMEAMDAEIEPRYRYRLMEYRPPADSNYIYADTREEEESPVVDKWFLPGATVSGESSTNPNPYKRVLAENIIAFAVSPRNSVKQSGAGAVFDLAPDYSFDSYDAEKVGSQPETTQNYLPPLVHVTMIAISEESAIRLQARWEEEEPPQLAFDEGWFSSTPKYYRDLRSLESQLQSNSIEYRTFSTMVRIKASQFTQSVLER